jgi:hypothetical protein
VAQHELERATILEFDRRHDLTEFGARARHGLEHALVAFAREKGDLD